MPKLSQVTTVSEEVAVEIRPELQKKLRKELHLYAAKAAQKKVIQADIDALKDRLEDILAEVGEDKVKFEGFTAGIVGGERSTFDKKLFVKLGGNLDVYNKAMVKKPTKASVRVYVPGENDTDD